VAVTPLWLPGGPLLDSLEAAALDDLTPPLDPDSDPWRDAA
jgi:hypothetical protein